MSIETKYIPDVFADIVSKVRLEYDTDNNERPFFYYGHPLEIERELALRDQNNILKFKKYPLIALYMDIEEDKTERIDLEYTISPTLLIMHRTVGTYTSEERYTEVFKPKLYPLYNLLIQKISESVYTNVGVYDTLPHTKTDRLYWGSSSAEGNTATGFNDYIDAIQIDLQGLEIFKTFNCQ